MLLVSGFAANAQTESGNYLMGGNLQLNTSGHNTVIQLDPTVGYFFVDNFAGGLNLNLGYTKVGESPNAAQSSTLGLGPFIRYYVGSANVRPFLDVDGNFSSKKNKIGSDYSTTSTGITYFVGPGAAFFLNRNVALEGLVGYQHAAYKNQIGSGGFAFKLGFQVYLNRTEVNTVTNP